MIIISILVALILFCTIDIWMPFAWQAFKLILGGVGLLIGFGIIWALLTMVAPV